MRVTATCTIFTFPCCCKARVTPLEILQMQTRLNFVQAGGAAATLAFLDAKIAKSSDKEASAAAADAYIEANAANGGKRSEACRKAAEAYIKLL